MARPRLMLVPQMCAIEWTTTPILEEWAEVATFDGPGLDGHGDPRPATVAERALEELGRRDWDSCFVVADEFAGAAAARLCAARPEAIDGLALGHACLSWETRGARAPINEPVFEAFLQLARGDYRTYAQHLSQTTMGAYDEQLSRQFMERVPQDVAVGLFEYVHRAREPIGELLGRLDAPLLFAEHKDCLMFTREGFEDAVAAFPRATALSVEGKPSASPEFAEALRKFCDG